MDLWPVWWETGCDFVIWMSSIISHQFPIKPAIHHPLYTCYSCKNPSIYHTSVWSVFSITLIDRSYWTDTVSHNIESLYRFSHMYMNAVLVSSNRHYFLNVGTLLFWHTHAQLQHYIHYMLHRPSLFTGLNVAICVYCCSMHMCFWGALFRSHCLITKFF